MRRYFSRLTVSLFILVCIVLLSIAFLLGQLLKAFQIEQFENEIIQKGEYISAQLNLTDQITRTHLSDASELFGVNLFVMTDDELQAVDKTATNLSTGDWDLLNKWFKYGKDHRQFVTLTVNDIEQYFHPIKISSKLTQFNSNNLLLGVPIKQVDESIIKITRLILISFLIGIFVIVFFGSNILQYAMQSTDSAMRAIKELTKGNFKSYRAESEKFPEIPLNKAVENLADQLQENAQQQRIQHDRLTTLVENIGSGLIFIDGHGYINLINQPCKDIFQLEGDNYEGQHYYDVISFTGIITFIEEIFMTEQNVRRQITLPVKIERRHYEVYGAPIIGENSSWKGTVLVFHDITELKKLEKMRKDFVANVSHELKTPITSIKGFSETLLDGASNDEEVLETFLTIILKESERLQSLLQDLLDLSKIEETTFALNRQDFNIVNLLDEITTLLTSRSKEKAINLQFDKTNLSNEIVINADFDRIKQLFINVINNAITYSPENGQVTIKLEAMEDVVNVYITDTGIGIAEREIPRIFERFYRVDKARSRDSGGTGLGLAIVKHIVEAHNGQINVKSVLGKGTTFIITLPKLNNDRTII